MKSLRNYHLLFFQLIVLIHFRTIAQNLIPNHGFEETIQCPAATTGFQNGYTTHWYQPTSATPDLFNTCGVPVVSVPNNYFGRQMANSGEAYAGLFTYWKNTDTISPQADYREYISVRLTDALLPGNTYYLSYYISRADNMHYATKLGVLISIDSIYSMASTSLNYTPTCEIPSYHTDKSSWTNITCSFIAQGGEKFLTIGNFRNDPLSDTINTHDGSLTNPEEFLGAYYYIDDICLSPDSSCFDSNQLGLNEIALSDRKVVKMINLMGQDSLPQHGVLLIYLYNDGTTEKVFIVD